jgi:hypothetical protein
MPRPSKQKAAARKRNKSSSDTASEWEETHSEGYSSGTESPESMSETEGNDKGDDEGDDGWRREQQRLYSLAYHAPPMKTVSQIKWLGEWMSSDMKQTKRKAGETLSATTEKKLQGSYTKKSRTTTWRREKHAKEQASDIRGFFKLVSGRSRVSLKGSPTQPLHHQDAKIASGSTVAAACG